MILLGLGTYFGIMYFGQEYKTDIPIQEPGTEVVPLNPEQSVQESENISNPNAMDKPEELSFFPNLIGMNINEASQKLTDIGCYYRIEYVRDEEKDPLCVLNQSEIEGAEINPDKLYVITVNSLTPDEIVEVEQGAPNVVGLNMQTAMNQIIDAGYGIKKIISTSERGEYSDAQTEDVVKQIIENDSYVLYVYVPERIISTNESK